VTIDEANRLALDAVLNARPVWTDVRPAADVIPGMDSRLILHAGPPLDWDAMSGPLRGAVVGGILYEGWAATPEEALSLIAEGGVRFDSCHHHATVGPMAGVVTPSMPVAVVENRHRGNRAYATLNEGLGRVLRYGAYDAPVLERLRWFRDVLGPLLAAALRQLDDGIDLRHLMAQAIQMGDEGHNRHKAGSALLLRELAPAMVTAGFAPEALAHALKFLASNEFFSLNPVMAACKATMDAAHNVPGSTLVTAMARNGTHFGIRVSGLGDRWFTAPSAVPRGLYFPGFSEDDANPDIGDSTITETAGLGGFAMAAAPAIVRFVSGTTADAVQATLEMYEITLAENEAFQIPSLDFRGTPTGIDIRKVVATGITPRVNTGIAHKQAGVGQIGAGLVRPPLACFEQAVEAMVEEVERSRRAGP
jgi:hypothetical protein